MEVGRPVTAGSEVEPGRRLGAGLLGEQPLVRGLVGDLGGEVLEDTAAEVPQLSRPERPGPARPGRPRPSRAGRHPGRREAPRRLRRPPGPGPGSHRRHQAPRRSAFHFDPRDAANAACRRTVPWLSRVRVANQVAVDRSPVESAMSSEAASTRSRSASARLINREIRSRSSCFSSTVRNSGLIAASSSNPRIEPVERLGVRAGHRTIQAPTTDSPMTSEPLVHKGNPLSSNKVECRASPRVTRWRGATTSRSPSGPAPTSPTSCTPPASTTPSTSPLDSASVPASSARSWRPHPTARTASSWTG